VRSHYPPSTAARAMPIHFNFRFSIQRACILKGSESMRKLPNSFQRIHDANVSGLPIKDDAAPQSQGIQRGRGRR
jgi:hypothetical protein